MVGKVIGDIKVLKFSHKDKHNHKYFLVECTICKRTKFVSMNNLKKFNQSHQNCSKLLTDVDARFRSIYYSMRTRTTNPKAINYKHYGGKGVNSEAWKYFIDFYDDMYESYLQHVKEFGERDTTLDRIDNTKNYCKDNCKWSTRVEQNRNREYVKGGK